MATKKVEIADGHYAALAEYSSLTGDSIECLVYEALGDYIEAVISSRTEVIVARNRKRAR